MARRPFGTRTMVKVPDQALSGVAGLRQPSSWGPHITFAFQFYPDHIGNFSVSRLRRGFH